MADWDSTVYFKEFKNGTEQGFKKLHKKYYASLVFFANRIIDDLEESKDIAQQTFGKLYEGRERFSTENNIKSFLYIAVKNACFDYLRSRHRLEVKLKEYAYLASDTYEGEEQLVTDWVLELLYAAIEELPPTRKTVLKMLFFEKMKLAAVAEKLGISISTVKEHRKFALRDLRAKLPPDVFLLLLVLHVELFALLESQVAL